MISDDAWTWAIQLLESSHIRKRCKKYGISLARFCEIGTGQRWACRICRRQMTPETLVIDHNHASGVVRGLLCAMCNRALGLLGDSETAAGRAGKYLRSQGSYCSGKKGDIAFGNREAMLLCLADLRRREKVLASEHRRIHKYVQKLHELGEPAICTCGYGPDQTTESA